MNDKILESPCGNSYGCAQVKKCEEGFYFSVEDECCGTKWVKVSKHFYEAFVLEFGKSNV
jgi:hypothetical protein